MEMSSIWLGEANLLGCYLRDIEHFSEFKMAAATIFDVEHFSTVHPDTLDGRVIPLFGVIEGGEFISGVIFFDTWSVSRSNQRSNVKFGSKIISIFISLQSAISQRNRLQGPRL